MTGYCPKHGHFTACQENAMAYHQLGTIYVCPVCGSIEEFIENIKESGLLK